MFEWISQIVTDSVSHFCPLRGQTFRWNPGGGHGSQFEQWRLLFLHFMFVLSYNLIQIYVNKYHNAYIARGMCILCCYCDVYSQSSEKETVRYLLSIFLIYELFSPKGACSQKKTPVFRTCLIPSCLQSHRSLWVLPWRMYMMKYQDKSSVYHMHHC